MGATNEEAAITMAMQSMQPAKTQLSRSAMPLRPPSARVQESHDLLKAKEFFQMELMKKGEKGPEDEKVLRCQQDAARYAKKVAGNAALLGGLMSGCDALALVDDRLNGDGAGIALGVNDPALGWVLVGVFTLVWSLYYAATKSLGGFGEDDGLGLS